MLLSKFRRVLLSGVSLCAMLVAPALFADDKELTSSDRLLPPGVLLHVRISDVADLKERLPKTGFGQMYQDDSMAKIRSQVDKLYQKAAEEAAKDLGFPLSDLLNLPQGEASVAVLQPAGRKLAVVALMEIGEEQETLDKLLGKLDEAMTSKGGKKKTETVEEVDVTIYEMPKPENGPSDAEAGKLCYFTKDGMFVGGSSLAVLQDVLTRWEGESDDVLAEQELYAHIHSKCSTRSDDGDSVMEWYVNPVGLATAAMNADENQATQALMFTSYLPVIGLDKFKAAGGSLDLAEGDYDMHSKMFVYVDQPTSGVVRAFEFPATDLTPPAWVGADTPQYSSMDWDIAGAYTALTEMADSFLGQGTAEQKVNEATERFGFQLKKDLIDHLNGQIVILGDIDEAASRTSTATTGGQKYLVAVKLKDSVKIQETLNAILEKSGLPVVERDFEGTKVYDIQAPNEQISPAMSIAKDHFFIASHADILESALRPNGRGDETLAESEGFRQMQKLFPAKNSMLSYSDMAQQLKPTYEMLKSGKYDGATEGQFDFGVLPDFEKIAKFFSVTGSYTVPDEKGVFSESFILGVDE